MEDKELLFRNIYRSIRDAYIPKEYWYAEFDEVNSLINIYIKEHSSQDAKSTHWILKKECLELEGDKDSMFTGTEHSLYPHTKSCWEKCCQNIKRLFGFK